MNSVEERLRVAADETRRLAEGRAVRALPVKDRSPARGWLVFAAAFATVTLTFGLLPWLASTSPSPTTNGTAALATSADLPTTVAAEESCSASGVAEPGRQPGLPDAVAEKRDAMIDAALACDLDRLEPMAGDPFTTSYGESDFGHIVQREDGDGDGGLGDLVRLFDMPYGTVELEPGVAIYVWPAALTYETWGDIPEDEVEELRRIHTDDEIAAFEQFGGYAGWRIGIRQDGSWMYYVAGD